MSNWLSLLSRTAFKIHPVKAKQLRRLALTDPDAFRRLIKGARQREMVARHLLLHPELIATASVEDRRALSEYVADEEWKSLYGHDRRMCRLLRAGLEKLKTDFFDR